MKSEDKLYEYELITYGNESLTPRKYRIFNLTEEEAHIKNQGYAFNGVEKRFVRLEPRIKKES